MAKTILLPKRTLFFVGLAFTAFFRLGPALAQPDVLTEWELDAVTAGGLASRTGAIATAVGERYARARATASNTAQRESGIGRTAGGAVATSAADGFAATAATGSSVADTAAVEVSALASAVSNTASASSSVWTGAIDTPYVDVAIGRASSYACCGPDAIASTTGAGSATGDHNLTRVLQQDVTTPRGSRSLTIVVVISTNGPTGAIPAIGSASPLALASSASGRGLGFSFVLGNRSLH